MSASGKRWKFNTLFTSTCGCRPKETDAVEPKLKSETDQKRRRSASSSVSSGERHGGRRPKKGGGGCTSTTFSPNTDSSPPQMISPCPKINDSLAVAKESDDPYLDFRQSMVEMISEKEIYSRSDLQQLLRCFLDLNPPHHHETIVRAFLDIWNGGVVVADGGEERTPPCSA